MLNLEVRKLMSDVIQLEHFISVKVLKAMGNQHD